MANVKSSIESLHVSYSLHAPTALNAVQTETTCSWRLARLIKSTVVNSKLMFDHVLNECA